MPDLVSPDSWFTVNTDNDDQIEFNWLNRNIKKLDKSMCIEFKTDSLEKNFNVAVLNGGSYDWVKDGTYHDQTTSHTEDHSYYFILTAGEGNIYAWGSQYSIMDPHTGPAPVNVYYRENQDGNRQCIIIYYGNSDELPDPSEVINPL